MEHKNCIAMILAGGRGERLGSLTSRVAKPAVTFGGSHKIIDFTLNNCKLSEINNISVLTQYLPSELHDHIRRAHARSAERMIFLLPSRAGSPYAGTADAVYRNMMFIDYAAPEHILVLSGDHVYEMDYRKMLEFHMEKNADATIASTPVPFHETFRFGILSADKNGLIGDFEEKPKHAKSNLASMGVYIFKWDVLRRNLISDAYNETSAHDFGKNIIPDMLARKEKLFSYTFNGYWKDIGTVYSLWDAHMELVHAESRSSPMINMCEIIKRHNSGGLEVRQSLITNCETIKGRIGGSVISENVKIGEGSVITDCVIMPNVSIGRNVRLTNAVIGEGAVIMDNVEIGAETGVGAFTENNICSMGISLAAPRICIAEGMKFMKNSHIDKSPTPDMIRRSQSARQIPPVHTAY